MGLLVTDAQRREWIDGASYEELLRKWRFATTGDPFFRDEIGVYYSQTMARKREADPSTAVAASKNIGWDR